MKKKGAAAKKAISEAIDGDDGGQGGSGGGPSGRGRSGSSGQRGVYRGADQGSVFGGEQDDLPEFELPAGAGANGEGADHGPIPEGVVGHVVEMDAWMSHPSVQFFACQHLQPPSTLLPRYLVVSDRYVGM